MNSPTVQTGHKRKTTGFLHAKIGGTFSVTLSDGRTTRLTVKDRSRTSAELLVRCLTCGKEADEPEALYQMHPEDRDMKKRGESHVWAYFAEEGLTEFESSAPADFGKTQAEIAEANRQYAASDAGLFADATFDS